MRGEKPMPHARHLNIQVITLTGYPDGAVAGIVRT
jgi:phosphoheptose isomerase